MMGSRPLVPSPTIAGLKLFYKRALHGRRVTTFYSESQDWKLPKEGLSFSPPLVSGTRFIESSWHRRFPVIGSKGITGSFPWECMSFFHSSTQQFSNYFPHSCSTQGTPKVCCIHTYEWISNPTFEEFSFVGRKNLKSWWVQWHSKMFRQFINIF